MPSQQFTVMKFNILTAALQPAPVVNFDDAYLYAWDTGVYPVFHGGAPWHAPFADEFEVSEEMMDELVRRLDEAWDLGRGTAPTFYELEDIYDARHGGGAWTRSTLIHAMRYIALNKGSFSPTFFGQVTRNMGAPSEANSFAAPFDRHRDIYFM